MKILTTITTVGAALAVLGGGGIWAKDAVVWAADQRYVTKDKLGQTFALRDIRAYSDKIDDLNDKQVLSSLTPLERARLKRLKNRRDELRKELENVQ